PSARDSRSNVSVNIGTTRMRRSLYNWHDHLASVTTRRAFLAVTLLGAPGVTRALADIAAPPDVWASADAILQRIRAPRFRDRTFDVTEHGATRTADATAGFRAAIAECARAGGGRVVVPRGRFETGALHLPSSVNLHLEDGATIAFNRDPKAY